MRTIYFKTTEDSLVNFDSSTTSIILSNNLPFGVEYKEECSCELTPSEISSWWGYVDTLRTENPITNFHSVWKIIENGNTYGYTN